MKLALYRDARIAWNQFPVNGTNGRLLKKLPLEWAVHRDPNDTGLPRSWPSSTTTAEQEESRRTFYVAMTRARHLLTLFEDKQHANLHTRDLDGPAIHRRVAGARVDFDPDLLNHCYTVLGLDELHLGYAAQFDTSHRIHQDLQRLNSGDAVRLVRSNGGVMIVSATGHPVGRLSARGAQHWAGHLDRIIAAQVLAILRQTTDPGRPEYAERDRVPLWELPLIEITHRPLASPCE